ncbi:helix-turn-helix domain-containing protein [Nocardia abscessus]|uniref:helix-turn-helix domain-containing protein n=1 Tax=Nocardia abscessus TaxID=120957 RepID=UPI0005BD3DBF
MRALAQHPPVGLIAKLMQVAKSYVRQVIHDFNTYGFETLDPNGHCWRFRLGWWVSAMIDIGLSGTMSMEVVVSLRPRRCDVVPVETVLWRAPLEFEQSYYRRPVPPLR